MAACTSGGGLHVPIEVELQGQRGLPRELVEVISLIPAMRPKRRSSGVATADAIVSGLALGHTGRDVMWGNRRAEAAPPAMRIGADSGDEHRRGEQRGRHRTRMKVQTSHGCGTVSGALPGPGARIARSRSM